jgi:diguanylate cyclase (GGDEF)-like protein
VNRVADSLDRREAAVLIREQAADSRDQSLAAQAAAAEQAARLAERGSAQLREANERLVVATMNAQWMTEVAQAATVEMAYMAQHDFLTGLPNRLVLADRLAQAIALAHRHQRKGALMFLDLDRFKQINDSLGHHVGDQLLRSTALRLQSCVRMTDTVSRQGGDEFVVLLPEVDSQAAAIVTAEKLLKQMAEPHLIGDQRVHVSLSIGICLFPDDATDAETVMKNADTAMYQAKTCGRNNCQVFTADMNERELTRRSVEEALRQALEHRDFVLLYQPKVNLETGAITGAEALVRMRGGGAELVGPSEFVATAEDCGLILPIGSWVLREACRQAAEWLKAGLPLGQISVNVSAVEFHGKEFFAGVCAILRETGLDPRRLELELTETGLIQDTERTAGTLRALKHLGVQIAVDDFGTGYSSLSYLRRFPIDTLKIDQSFVREIEATGDNAIVSAIIAMGLSLKQRVVAEGIELPEQLAFLQAHHCAEGQGYYFSRPVTAGVFAALLRPAHGGLGHLPAPAQEAPGAPAVN